MPVPLPDDEPLSVVPHTDRADRLAFILASLVALVVYFFSLTTETTLGDSGVLTTSAFYGGVAGPPGQPVWTLYSWVFTKILPFSNVAWRVAVGSAVAGTLLCGFVAMIISFSANAICKNSTFIPMPMGAEWDKVRIGGGVAASLVLGFNGWFWSEAVSVDISSFSLLLFASVLWLVMRVSFYSAGCGALCLALFVFGMLLTSSQELLVALPGLVCLLMLSRARLGRDLAILFLPLAAAFTVLHHWNANPWPWTGEARNWPMISAFAIAIVAGGAVMIRTNALGSHWKSVLAAVAGFTGGLAFYLYLPAASMSTPPMNWGYPRTVEGFCHAIARGQYERINPTGSLKLFCSQLGHFLADTGEEFGWVYLCIAALGAGVLCRSSVLGRRWLMGLGAVWLCTGPIMVAMVNPGTGLQSRLLTMPFFCASYIILAVLLGLGLITVGAWITRSSKSP